jgi:hypothetical protein
LIHNPQPVVEVHLFEGCNLSAMALDNPFSKYNVAGRLYKQSLLNAIILVAGTSIFFFGYDQGLMGGVNTNRSYAELMRFGYYDEQSGDVVVTKPLLQGSLVRILRLLKIRKTFSILALPN